MPVKKNPKKNPKIWVPEPIYSGSQASVFIHPKERKVFRKGAEEIEWEAFGRARKAHNRMVKRTPFFYKKMAPKRVSIMKYVKKKGLLPAEDIVYYNPRNKDLLVRNKGTALQFMLNKGQSFNQTMQKSIVHGLMDYFSRLHSIGVEHHHPGTNNLVFHDGKISAIDFKFAAVNPKLNWRNPKEVFNFFREDYRCLLMLFKSTKITEISKEQFIHELISKYSKMNKKEKQLLEQLIKKELKKVMENNA